MATLTEVSFDPTVYSPRFNVEVFADKEHIARASVHMTLSQLSQFNLKQVVSRALSRVDGIPIDVRNPMIRNHRPVADVVIVCGSGSVSTVSVDLLTGQTSVL